MPGSLLVPSCRNRRSEHYDDDDSGAEFPASYRSGGSKRARLDSDAPSESSQEPVLPHTYRNDARPRIDHENITIEVHKPGSIVRVRMTNFVTYTSAEFQLGPSLNMIIGPNGTGKSTLVCAICLGLGWGPQHLGRAKELGEFVKHGAREAEIEIELKGGEKQRERNPVIRRTIKKEGNKSAFVLNGRPSPQKEIIGLCKSFSIQIDNLCQFLPQDRVVAFAQQTPVELLEATQRAAAPEHMVQWHEELKKLRTDQKKMQVDDAQNKEHLKSLQDRQNQQRADVERLNERKLLQEMVAVLQKIRPLPLYSTAQKNMKDAKEKKQRAQAELADLKQEVAPALRAVNEKIHYRDSIKAVMEKRKMLVDHADRSAEAVAKETAAAAKAVEDAEAEAKTEKERDKERNQDLARIKQQITNIERQMEQEPVDFDPAAYNERIREKTRQIRQLQEQADDVDREMREKTRSTQEKRGLRDEASRELETLHSQAGQQERRLRMLSTDTAKAWDWVQKNQGKFKDKIFGPAIVECSINDARYIDIIEMCFQRNDYLAITCQSREDFQVLQEYIYGKHHQNLKDVSIRVSAKTLSSYRSPVDQQQLQQLDLTAFAIDFLSGPEPVLSMLCDSSNFHRIAVTLQKHNTEQFERLRESPVQAWIAGDKFNRVVRRQEYGASSTTVRDVRPAKIWTDQAVDVGAEQELNQKIQDYQRACATLHEQYNELKQRKLDLRSDIQTINDEKDVIEKEKQAKQQAVAAFQALPTKKASLEEKRDFQIQRGEEVKELVQASRQKADSFALERGRLALKYANAVEILRKAHDDLYESEFLLIEAQSDVDVLTTRNSEVNELLKQRQQDVIQAQADYKKYLEVARRVHAEVNLILENKTELENQLIEQHQNKTSEELETEIESTQMRLSLLHGGNPEAIKQFEERQKRIDHLERSVARLEEELAQFESRISDIREQWEPEIDALVGKISEAFSYNFSKIGCAGEVGIYKDDDFNEWAIQIRVKFREEGELSLLDSHRQSGGERAVSTIFYLMALQSLARSPFRVVDEINQGMDPRNERMVHERMVDIACEENTSQYFLVTPKLLNGLKFHPKMKVHCIASGEYMPVDFRQLDFPKLAAKALTVRGKA
ncbi:putative ABC/SMC5 protein [Patellaria atrata CBS 101060]|uniref:Structural maintenance of chromosomes protein 5 n=1 Tax=Patellaria atrata CBS 101060 TaxID=1346257 RepID=A0A9P4SC47_9PEZI|nr:putative ABC/SMC5 protein [Patellaria atrata CBS 101060]